MLYQTNAYNVNIAQIVVSNYWKSSNNVSNPTKFVELIYGMTNQLLHSVQPSDILNWPSQSVNFARLIHTQFGELYVCLDLEIIYNVVEKLQMIKQLLCHLQNRIIISLFWGKRLLLQWITKKHIPLFFNLTFFPYVSGTA